MLESDLKMNERAYSTCLWYYNGSSSLEHWHMINHLLCSSLSPIDYIYYPSSPHLEFLRYYIYYFYTSQHFRWTAFWKFRKSQGKKGWVNWKDMRYRGPQTRWGTTFKLGVALSIVPQPLEWSLTLIYHPKNRNADSEANQNTLENNTTTMAPTVTHTLSGSDTVTPT